MNRPTSVKDRPTRELFASQPADRAPRSALVVGASGGIGRALSAELCVRYPGVHLVRMARALDRLPPLTASGPSVALDLGNQDSIEAAVSQLDRRPAPDWILISSGWLHDHRWQPEKTFRQLDADHLAYAFQVNAIGPMMLVKQLVSHYWAAAETKIGVLSARVGSISDNRLGGWHAYRSSKAALNMMIRNLGIELARSNPGWCIAGLHPGTTDTPLSAPFQRRLPAGQLQSAPDTAARLVRVMAALSSEDSGYLYDHNGRRFDP